MAPPGKVPKQTSIDLFSRPGTRHATKDAAGKEPGAEKLDKKQKETVHQEQSGAVRATLRRGHSYMKILRDRGELNRHDTLTQW